MAGPIKSEPLAVGDVVRLKSGQARGVVRYIGNTHFKAGEWIGVELTTPVGKNDGTILGRRYFQCSPRYGIFVRPPAITKECAYAFQESQRVRIFDQDGTVRFVGSTEFGDGLWTGIELDEPMGYGNGSVNGVSYFNCAVNHGLFVQIHAFDPESLNRAPLQPVGRQGFRMRGAGKEGSKEDASGNPMDDAACNERPITVQDAAGYRDSLVVDSDGNPVAVEAVVQAFEDVAQELEDVQILLDEARDRENKWQARDRQLRLLVQRLNGTPWEVEAAAVIDRNLVPVSSSPAHVQEATVLTPRMGRCFVQRVSGSREHGAGEGDKVAVESLDIELGPDDSIQTLKQKVWDRCGVEPSRQLLSLDAVALGESGIRYDADALALDLGEVCPCPQCGTDFNVREEESEFQLGFLGIAHLEDEIRCRSCGHKLRDRLWSRLRLPRKQPTFMLTDLSSLVADHRPLTHCNIHRCEERAITAPQLRRLLDFVERWHDRWYDVCPTSDTFKVPLRHNEITWHQLNDWVVRPATYNAKCSFVELVAKNPTQQQAGWFVSHWWGQSVLDVVQCIEEHARLRGEARRTAYWICALANRPYEHGAVGSPMPDREPGFVLAMRASFGTLLILDKDATPFTRLWCCYEIACAKMGLHGKGPESEVLDIATVADGSPKLLTETLVKEEQHKQARYDSSQPSENSGWHMKAIREASFPIDVVQPGLQIDLAVASTSAATDRCRIINAIARKPCFALDQEFDPNSPIHAKISCALRAYFAVAIWRLVIEAQIDIEAPETKFNFSQVLKEDVGRSTLALCFAGLSKLRDCNVATVVRCLPETLQHLDLQFSSCVKINSVVPLAKCLRSLSSLRHLHLNFEGCKSLASMDKLACGVRVLTELQHLELNFSGCKELSSVDMLGEGVRALPGLRHLSLKFGKCFNITSMDALAQGIAEVTCLQHLQLSFEDCWSLESLDVLAEALQAQTRLQDLRLKFSNCRELTSVEKLAQGIGGLTSLQRIQLDFGGCLALTSLEKLGTGLRAKTNLRHLELNLANCSFDATELVDLLGEALLALQSLQHLESHFRGCTALSSADTLWEGIAELSNLTHLNLNFGECTSLASVDKLGEGLLTLANLQHIELDFDHCTTLNCIEKLRESLYVLRDARCQLVLPGHLRRGEEYFILEQMRERVAGGPRGLLQWLLPRLSETWPGDPKEGLLELQWMLLEVAPDDLAEYHRKFTKWLHVAPREDLRELLHLLTEWRDEDEGDWETEKDEDEDEERRTDKEGSSTSASTKDDKEQQRLSEHRRLSGKLVWHGARRFSGGPKQFGDWLAPRLSKIQPGDPRAGLFDLQQLLVQAPSDDPAKGWHAFFQWLHTAWPNQLEQLTTMLMEGQDAAMQDEEEEEEERGLGRRRTRGKGMGEDPHSLTAELVRESARQFPSGPQEFIAWLRHRLADSRAEELQVSIQQLKQHFKGIRADDTKANQDKFTQWLKRAACQDIRALLEFLVQAQQECIQDASPQREPRTT